MLTVQQVASQYHVSARSVWRLLEDGKLPRVKIRNCTRIPAHAAAALFGGA